MDDIKDIKKGDAFIRFIDAQHLRTDPFGNNRAAERLYGRVERISTALYLLTRHIAQSEPIRERIRSESVGLLSRVLDLRDEMRTLESSSILDFQSAVRHLISLVRILTAGGFVSLQNTEVVVEALDELSAFVSSSQRSSFSEGVSLTLQDIMGDTGPLAKITPVKDKISVKDREVIKDNQGLSMNKGSETTKVRSDGIVAILGQNGALGIKEICARLPDYSEKMIQRELAALVKNGRVTKNGFKRWSTYALAK
jgi:hypothetical protein